MRSTDDYIGQDAPSDHSSAPSHAPSRTPSRAPSRRQSSAPLTPRKRPRAESTDPAHVRKAAHLEENYNDAYRRLFNQDVLRVAARFETATADDEEEDHTWRIGASLWSPQEQTILFAALERLGRDDVPGIAAAIGTKSIPEIHQVLFLLHELAVDEGDANLTLCDIPAAVELSDECNGQLDLAGEALAWYQETCEAEYEQDKFGDYWLITPAVADEVESAIVPERIRDPTTPILSESESRGRAQSRGRAKSQGREQSQGKGGYRIAGACTSCKKSKLKCDRNNPCSNCERRNTECIYPNQPDKNQQPEDERPETERPETPKNTSDVAGILKAIPEAELLHPQVMLRLSKTVFMNRSPTIPSPWSHWSEYTSELAQEPSIYRTAFGDFHNLVVSLTKRLVQTAIMQATSRLRSGRHRVTKGTLPLVQKSDVLAAIDVLGMQRNSQERWRGVARRCALRVYDDGHLKRTKKEVPWDEVERIMSSIWQSDDATVTDTELSENDHVEFRSRAARKGTPLPMDRLALSDSDDESLLDESEPASRCTSKSRDSMARDTSVPPTTSESSKKPPPFSLEQFDREASRQEEHALWTMLDLKPPAKDDEYKSDEDNEEEGMEDEAVITQPDGWRSWTDYRADWEQFDVLPDTADFIANQKPLAAPSALQEGLTDTVDSASDDETGLARKKRPQHRQSKSATIELRTLNTQAYAKLQGRASENTGHTYEDSSQDGDASDDAAHERPVQSIEGRGVESSPAPRSIDSDGDDVDMNQPAKSIETDVPPFVLSLSDDDGSLIQDRPVQSLEARSKLHRTVYSDDEMEDMDWNSFID